MFEELMFFINKRFCLVYFKLFVLLNFFFIRTSNFGAEADRSFFFRFEAENVLKTFLEDLSTFL